MRWGISRKAVGACCALLALWLTTATVDAVEVQKGIFNYANDPKLAKIMEIASFKNPNIAAAIEKVNQTRAELGSARAKFGPTVSANVGAQWNKDQPTVLGIPSGYRNAYNASLSFIQTLYSGGTITANKRAAEFAMQASQAEGVRVYQNVLNAVRVNYYECQRALATLQVAVEALNLSEAHLKQTEALQKAGLVPMGDVLRVKVSVSQSELDRISAENALDVTWVALERIVGTSLPRDEILKPVDGTRTHELEPPSYVVPQQTVDRALAQRAEIRAYEFYKKQADQMVKAAAGQHLPRIALSGQTSTADDHFWPHGSDTWYVQLGMEWTLFDSGDISSQVERAKASARQLLYQIDDLNGQVRQEVVQAELSLRSALTRLDVAEDQIRTAEEDYRIALKRYDAQVGTNLDVLDARVALTDSRTAYVNAVYDIASAQSGLIYAMGDDTPSEELFGGGETSEAALSRMRENAVSPE